MNGKDGRFAKKNIIVGQKFNRLTIIKEVYSESTRRFLCSCSCGKVKDFLLSELLRGNTKSCGCLRDEICRAKAFKHGGVGTKEYNSWHSMLGRCYTPTDKNYENYGGRGITVCEEWKNSYATFITDMGKKPTPAHTIDRIDNNGPYSKENCRWATKAEQSNNQRNNHLITMNGVTLNVANWAKKLGVSYTALRQRLASGWDEQKALLTPIRKIRTW